MTEEKKEIDKWLAAITRMIMLTQQGKLKWTVDNSDKTSNDHDRISAVFTTNYKNKSLRLFALRINVKPNDLQGIGKLISMAAGETSTLHKKVILEIVNPEGFAIWTFPEIAALSDLLSAVQYQVAGVSEFLDDILDEADAIAS